MTVRAPSGNHPDVTPAPGPLQAGSPIAQAVHRLWSGEPVVTYPADGDWLDAPIEIARQLAVLRGDGLQVSFIAPNFWYAHHATRRILRRLRGNPQPGLSFASSTRAPDRSRPVWGSSPLGLRRQRGLRRWYLPAATSDAHLLVLSAWDTQQGSKEPRVTVLHPWLSAVAARAACYRPRAGQILVRADWPYLDGHGLATCGNDWGDMPIEVTLAGAPE